MAPHWPRLLLRCMTSCWKGSKAPLGACPCEACHGSLLEDTAHYVLPVRRSR
jgi:hypothetical protein